MHRILILSIFAVSMACAAEDWGPLQFLIGNWTGEGNGAPGQAAGAFSFAPDLAGAVLVRKSYAEYPPSNGKPAFRHDDFTIVSRDSDSGQLRAMYYDSERHVISYLVNAVKNGVEFVSEGRPGGPRYRLTYNSTGPDQLKLRFEIAAAGKDFSTYLESTARRSH